MKCSTSCARVLIVESLAPRDLLEDFREARATADVLRTLGVKSVLERVRSRTELQAVCDMFASGEFDVLHIAAHGCDISMQLTDGSSVSWPDLVRMLGAKIDQKHLVLSMCHGGCERMVNEFRSNPAKPYAIIGPDGPIAWADLVVGWQVYYKSVLPCAGIEPDEPCQAVSRVHLATGAKFTCWQLESVDRGEREYMAYGSCPSCAFPVLRKTYPNMSAMDALAFAHEVAPDVIPDPSNPASWL